MPEIPIIPQKNTKNRLSFSLAGEILVNESAIIIPNTKAITLDLFHLFIFFPTKNIDAIISPKKNDHIYNG